MPVMPGPAEAKAAGNLIAQALEPGILSSMGKVPDYIGKAFPMKQVQPQDIATWKQAYERFGRIRQ